MVFGYTFRMFSEIKAMDLSGLDSYKMGIATDRYDRGQQQG